MGKYWSPIKWLGGAALIALVIAIVFPSVRDTIFSEQAQSAVLIQAVPFFAAFVCILLLFILLIVLVAKRFNGKIPHRMYSGVEYTLIAGILSGVVFLFQPFTFVAYRYGFLLVRGSLLGFILWSHVVGRNAKSDLNLPKYIAVNQLAGLIALVAIAGLLSSWIISNNQPQEPYGERQRVWNSYSDERKAEIRAAAHADFNNVEMPFVVIFSLFPSALLFFIMRELSAAMTGEGSTRETTASQARFSST
jgi:hypothetical protein